MNPNASEMEIVGGRLTSMWTWSGMPFISVGATFQFSHQPTEIGMEFRFDFSGNQGIAVFGAEYEMDENLYVCAAHLSPDFMPPLPGLKNRDYTLLPSVPTAGAVGYCYVARFRGPV